MQEYSGMKPRNVLRPVFPILLMALACEQNADRPATPPRADSTVAAEAADTGPTDREIAHALQTSNAVILRTASLARGRLSSGPARAYADTLIAHHTAYNLRVMRTFLAINMVPKESSLSDEMTAHSDSARTLLESMHGAAFERGVLESEIAFHERMAALLDQELIAAARDPRLQELLKTYRPMLAEHVALARAIL